MFSSPKHNRFSIIQSAQDELGNGNPHLVLHSKESKGKARPEGKGCLPSPSEAAALHGAGSCCLYTFLSLCSVDCRCWGFWQVLLSLNGLNWELLNKLLMQH